VVERFEIPVTEGALVAGVAPGSPAADAGIEPGDVIVGFGDAVVRTAEDLLAALRDHEPGDQVPVQIVRGGSETTLTVRLGEFPIDQ
jgi:S1-C subfamily serine protease